MFLPSFSRLVLCLVLVVGSLWPARGDGVPGREEITMKLKRGDFIVYRFMPTDPKYAARPLAVVVFGSGDGGFDGSEDHVGHALQAAGYEMLGFDCSAYADTDYDLATLQLDTNTIAQSALSRFGATPPPLILGGWSMGAEQAVAAAGGPHPPPGIVGLLLLSPGDRGRYGLRTTDKLDVAPTGPGTFALADFAKSLGNIRVVEWSADWDPFCSNKWLSLLTAPHKQFNLPRAFHDYHQFDDDFMKDLMESVTWIMQGTPPSDNPNSGPK